MYRKKLVYSTSIQKTGLQYKCTVQKTGLQVQLYIKLVYSTSVQYRKLVYNTSVHKISLKYKCTENWFTVQVYSTENWFAEQVYSKENQFTVQAMILCQPHQRVAFSLLSAEIVLASFSIQTVIFVSRAKRCLILKIDRRHFLLKQNLWGCLWYFRSIASQSRPSFWRTTSATDQSSAKLALQRQKWAW